MFKVYNHIRYFFGILCQAIIIQRVQHMRIYRIQENRKVAMSIIKKCIVFRRSIFFLHMLTGQLLFIVIVINNSV